MDDFEKLFLSIEKHIKNSSINIDDIKLIKKLNQIIINNISNKKEYKYTKKVPIEKSIKIVYDFLEQLNINYKNYFDLRLNDGTIIFEDDRNNQFTAYSDYVDNKRVIFIPVRNTIEDAYTIVHELFHDINLDEEDFNETRYIYTESLSFLGELLLKDYLKENKIKDYQVYIKNNFYIVENKAIEVDFNIRLIEKYLENGYFDMKLLFEVFENYPKEYISYLLSIISEICEEESLTMDNEQIYIFGYIIGSYMYKRIKENEKNINELFDLNEIIKIYSFESIISYLDIDFEKQNIFNELEDNYKKILKRN